ncbi:MAG: hypothetical protein H0U43_05685 [Chthoniobacterales bacterium]|nr:hypothetical protein [Chthoniobacterales bacterium]
MAYALHRDHSLTKDNMKYTTTNSGNERSTYALLLHSEDKEQSVSETIVYLLLIMSTVFSMWFAAHQPVRLPLGTVLHTASTSEPAAMPPRTV